VATPAENMSVGGWANHIKPETPFYGRFEVLALILPNPVNNALSDRLEAKAARLGAAHPEKVGNLANATRSCLCRAKGKSYLCAWLLLARPRLQKSATQARKAIKRIGDRRSHATMSATTPLLLRTESGWKVLVIWECETRDEPGLAKRLRRFLDKLQSFALAAPSSRLDSGFRVSRRQSLQ
jgi:hypothetical protein